MLQWAHVAISKIFRPGAPGLQDIIPTQHFKDLQAISSCLEAIFGASNFSPISITSARKELFESMMGIILDYQPRDPANVLVYIKMLHILSKGLAACPVHIFATLNKVSLI